MNLRSWLYTVAVTVLVGCTTSAPRSVAFELGAMEFFGGDGIVVEEVCSSSGQLDPGAVVTVRGKYHLATRDSGTLYLGTTTQATVAADGEPIASSCIVARGSGSFELRHRIPGPGHLHVTFYDLQSGAPFGGQYFGRGESLLIAKDWPYVR